MDLRNTTYPCGIFMAIMWKRISTKSSSGCRKPWKTVVRKHTIISVFAYSLGRGTQIDHNKAFSLYKKAFRLDPMDEEAANNLAVCYENGEGVEPDPREALRWYRRAKRLGKEGIEEEIERMKLAVKEM